MIDALWRPYLAGVMRGDGWVTPLTAGLRAKDFDFSQSFARALNIGFSLSLAPKRDERGYWLVRTSNKRGIYDCLITYTPRTEDEWCAWLRGLFDSEGNANLVAQPKVSANAFTRRVAFYSTRLDTLERAAGGLRVLGLKSILKATKNSAGHIGNKVVYQLRLSHSRDAFERFATMVGSSIERKQLVLDAIPSTYQPPGHHARASALGLAARRRTVEALA